VAVACVPSPPGGLSGGDLVFVRKSVEDLSPADPVIGEVDLGWPSVSLSRCEVAEGLQPADGHRRPDRLVPLPRLPWFESRTGSNEESPVRGPFDLRRACIGLGPVPVAGIPVTPAAPGRRESQP
jgi:hypothetical protein